VPVLVLLAVGVGVPPDELLLRGVSFWLWVWMNADTEVSGTKQTQDNRNSRGSVTIQIYSLSALSTWEWECA
jgi:hypothetical protein